MQTQKTPVKPVIDPTMLFTALAEGLVGDDLDDEEPPTLPRPPKQATAPKAPSLPKPAAKATVKPKPRTDRPFGLEAVQRILRSETKKRLAKEGGEGMAMLAAAEFVVKIVLRQHQHSKEFGAMKDEIHRFVADAYTRRPDTNEDAARDLADEWMEQADCAVRPLTAEELKARFAPASKPSTPPARKSEPPKARRSDPPKVASPAHVTRKSPDKRLVQVYIEDGHLSYLDAYVAALEAEPLIAANQRREDAMAADERAKQERTARQQAQEAKRASATYGAMACVPQPKKADKNNGKKGGGKGNRNKKAERAAAHA